MKLYDAMSPNSLRVHVFLAEKGIDVPRVPVDVMGGGTRTEAFLAINALGELPVLELDDGRILTESVAICRYLESLHPETPLLGTDPWEQAKIEMWTRRIELHLFEPLGLYARHSFDFFADKVRQSPEVAAWGMTEFDEKWAWFDRALSDGRPFAAGERFSVADITGLAVLLVCDFAGKTLPAELRHAKAWEARLRARPACAAGMPKAA